MKKNVFKVMLLWVVLIGFVLSLPLKAEALEPKLLWEKKLDFEVTELAFAKQSGDVLVNGGYGRQIILFDKDGNERFHWGPRVDRETFAVGITADGKYFFYTSAWTGDFIEKMNKESNDYRLHYVQRNGKELWSKPMPLGPNQEESQTTSHISPDGRYIAFVGVRGEGGGIQLWDIQTGKKSLEYVAPGADDFAFSPDSKYMVADYAGHIKLIDLAGNTLFSADLCTMVITSVAKEANYIATAAVCRKYNVAIIDKQGAVVLQGKSKKDYTLVSEDGNMGVIWEEDGIKAYSLPDKKLVGTFPIRIGNRQDFFTPLIISANGRILVATGSRINSSSTDGKNLFIIDILENTIWEGAIPSPQFQETYLAADGKYLLITGGGRVPGVKSRLFLYQVY